MQMPSTHPALQIARDIFASDGWAITDALIRDGEAVVVELRKPGQRLPFVCVSRDGDWPTPGAVSGGGQPVPSERRRTTLRHEPFECFSPIAAGWPPDGGQAAPGSVWMTVNAFAAEDTDVVRVTSSVDSHEARTRPDGSFLTLLRAAFRDEPRFEVQRANGEWREVIP